MSDEQVVPLLVEIRNLLRATSFNAIRSLLETALPDAQARLAYQALDGSATLEQARIVSKMSPNKLVALTQRWISMGLMEVNSDKKKKRLFDLSDFGLITSEE